MIQFLSMLKKYLTTFLLIVVSIFLIDYFTAQINIFNLNNQSVQVEQNHLNTENIQDSSSNNLKQTIFFLTAEVANSNAWELLKNSEQQIAYQEYDFGIYIEEINGLKANADNFWAIYVNDEKSLVGIQDIILNIGDVVEFRYEAIEK